MVQYNGAECTHDEKFKAAAEIDRLKGKRGGKARIEKLEGKSVSENHPALQLLGPGKSKDVSWFNHIPVM